MNVLTSVKEASKCRWLTSVKQDSKTNVYNYNYYYLITYYTLINND